MILKTEGGINKLSWNLGNFLVIYQDLLILDHWKIKSLDKQ